MKKLIVFAALLALSLQARAEPVKPGEIGAGIILGNPAGATAKYWVNERFALDAGLGFSDSRVALYGDLLYHRWDVLPQPKQGPLAAYAGLGGRIEVRRRPELALRTIVGCSFRPKASLEIFAEIGPTFQFHPDGDVGLDGGVGVRF